MKKPLQVTAIVGCALLLLGASRPQKPKTPAQQDLADTMKTRINPAMSELSFQIFHAPGGKPDDAKIRAALQTLNAESVALVRSRTLTEEPGFHAGAVVLQTSIEGLAAAYQTQESPEEINHWFSHVSAACNGCHSTSRD
jgi:cytochrome c556